MADAAEQGLDRGPHRQRGRWLTKGDVQRTDPGVWLRQDSKREAGHPGQQEVKCRWCIKGFRDPELDIIDKQSPTLAADTLAMVLQIIASKRWVMTVADVEGAFLQGPPLEQPCGRLFVQVPAEGVPGVSADAMVGVKKHGTDFVMRQDSGGCALVLNSRSLACDSLNLIHALFTGLIRNVWKVFWRLMLMIWRLAVRSCSRI